MHRQVRLHVVVRSAASREREGLRIESRPVRRIRHVRFPGRLREHGAVRRRVIGRGRQGPQGVLMTRHFPRGQCDALRSAAFPAGTLGESRASSRRPVTITAPPPVVTTRPDPVARLSPSLRRTLEQLRAGVVPSAALVEDLTGSRERIRAHGEGGSSPLEIVAPTGVIEETRPRFGWRSPAGGEHVVEVFDPSYRRVAAVPQ